MFRQALRGTVQEEKDLIFRKSGVAWLRFVFRTEGGKHNDFEKDLCMDVYLKPTCTPWLIDQHVGKCTIYIYIWILWELDITFDVILCLACWAPRKQPSKLNGIDWNGPLQHVPLALLLCGLRLAWKHTGVRIGIERRGNTVVRIVSQPESADVETEFN